MITTMQGVNYCGSEWNTLIIQFWILSVAIPNNCGFYLWNIWRCREELDYIPQQQIIKLSFRQIVPEAGSELGGIPNLKTRNASLPHPRFRSMFDAVSCEPRSIVIEQTRNFVNSDFSGTLRWPPQLFWSTGNFICSLQRSAAITIPEWCAV